MAKKTVRMRGRVKTLPAIIAASILTVITPVAAHAATSSLPCTDSESCPAPGWWQPGGDGKIFDDSSSQYSVTWVQSYVEAPPAGQVPAWFTAVVDYWNYGNSVLYFTCDTVRDPQLAKEWFERDGNNIGYVAATKTSCSDNPNLNFTLGPDRHFQVWATFHNVPWKGDGISIEWSIVKPDADPHPQSAYVDPYTQQNVDLGPLEPTTDPSQFLRTLSLCISERYSSPNSLNLSCATIIAQGAGVVIRLFVPRPAE